MFGGAKVYSVTVFADTTILVCLVNSSSLQLANNEAIVLCTLVGYKNISNTVSKEIRGINLLNNKIVAIISKYDFGVELE